ILGLVSAAQSTPRPNVVRDETFQWVRHGATTQCLTTRTPHSGPRATITGHNSTPWPASLGRPRGRTTSLLGLCEVFSKMSLAAATNWIIPLRTGPRGRTADAFHESRARYNRFP